MVDDAAEAGQVVDLPSFRPSKRRKVFRRRDASTSPPPASPTGHINLELPPADAITETSVLDEPSVTEIIRQRKAVQRRKGGGIGFTTDKSATEAVSRSDHEREGIIDPNAQRAMEVRTVTSRFAPQMGQVKEVMDKHM